MRHIRQVVTVVFLLSLTSCAVLDNSQGNTLNLGNNPKAIAEAFLTAWNENNLDVMYGNISVRSHQIYAPEDFARYYQTVADQIGLDGVSFTINEVTRQGTSAVIDYDLTLDSNVFGTIEDTGRRMRLVQDGEQWRVAWSTMDIFEGFTDDAGLSLESEPNTRANIYDRNGEPLVLQGGTVSAIWVRQQNMSDVAACQRLLADLLYTRVNNLWGLFSDYLPETSFYVGEVDEYIELEYAPRLQELCGTSREAGTIIPRQTRQYIGQGAAVHVTGYIAPVPEENRAFWINQGYRESDLVGLAGIEGAFEGQLAGSPARVLRVVEPGGTVLKELARAEGSPPQPVYLTIDRDLQIATSRALAWGYNYAINNWGRPDISPGAAAVVMDVNTGAILAMSSYPTFQPGLFNPDSLAENRGQRLAEAAPGIRNRATQERFSPGSVFKMVTTAAAVNEGLTQPGETFFCDLRWDGRERFGDTFSPRLDWRATDGLDATGTIVPSQALTSSCDPWYYEFGARLYLEVSPDAVVRYSNMMGLGGEPGLGDIYATVPSVIPVPPDVETAINNGIGQGDTQTTVLHNANMVTAIANGGTVYEPYIVERVGNETIGQPTVVNTLNLSPEALAVVQRGMCDVTTDPTMGTARLSFVANEVPPGYTVCGKTGTAQAGTYPNAWFVAYAPADEPEVAVVVAAQNSREGSEVAAPMVRRILDAYFGTQVAPFPEWWEEDYVPLAVPENGVAGG